MDLKEVIAKEHSRKNCEAIVVFIGSDASRFKELTHIFFNGDRLLTQRAAWPISVCAETHPELITPYLNKLLDLLPKKDVHNGVKRNITRLLQFIEIPKRLQGKTYSICLDLIADPKEFIAVKANAITVAHSIAKSEPVLAGELMMVAEPLLKLKSPALNARIRPLFGKRSAKTEG